MLFLDYNAYKPSFEEGFVMHEWALAEAILNAASETAEKERLKNVTKVKIRIGELQAIEPDVLEFALSQLKTGKFMRAEFEFENERAKLKCRACGHSWVFRKGSLGESVSEAIHFLPEIAHTYIKCPKCGSPDFEILEGRGVLLQRIEGVK